MDQQKSKQLSQLIECSNKMLKCAEVGDWDDVIEAEILRHDLIKALFSSPALAQDANEIDKATREILRINEMLKDHAMGMLYKVNSGIESISSGRRAISAYEENVR